MRRGRVALVGAGPGAPGLLTLRGRRRLRRADVVIYDRLVAPALLALAPAAAERVFVGKARGAHAASQGEIHALMIDRARRGRRVVRLKGGDPFVFGRGGEEALALAAAGVPCEVVPGVTSAVAAPAAAGIPLTHRGLASSFAVVTGEAAAAGARPDWARLAGAVDTLVILMGLEALPDIARALLAAGRAPATPVALVRAGTTAEQVLLTGTLADIARRAAAARLAPPAVVVVGEVVRLHAAVGAGVGGPARRTRRRARRAEAGRVRDGGAGPSEPAEAVARSGGDPPRAGFARRAPSRSLQLGR